MSKPIKRLLQATGELPFEVEQVACFHAEVPVDQKRSVVCEIIIDDRDVEAVAITYATGWPDELDVRRIAANPHDIAEAGRAMCKGLLPRGYGYPATPEYAARQSKLEGQVEMAAMHALTKALEEYYEGWLNRPDVQNS